MNSLRVLHVVPVKARESSYISAKRQIESHQEAGATCKTLFLPVRALPLRLTKDWQRIRREIRTFNPHLVHAHFGTLTAFYCAVATRRPVVLTYRGSDLNPNPDYSRWVWTAGMCLSQLAALRANQIICVSHQLKKKLWWRIDRTTTIPTGVDLRLFYQRPQNEVRRELGWEEKDRVVLFYGVRPKLKRLDLAQSALDVARNLCGDIRLVILDGSVEPDAIPTLMSGADCLLLTSDWEGSPSIIKEAMACNLPVVSVDVGDVRECLDEVEPTHIVPRDPDLIGRALAEVLVRRVRSNGCEAVQAFSSDIIASRVLFIYHKALNNR